jgi:hypothetical protein
MITRIFVLTAILFTFFQINSFAQVKGIPLYSGEIPNSKKTPASYKENLDINGLFTNISILTLTVYTPKEGTENGTAVIIFPSGGYRMVVDEGGDFAKAFISINYFLNRLCIYGKFRIKEKNEKNTICINLLRGNNNNCSWTKYSL